MPARLARTASDILAVLRARRPRVHCITNTVAQAFTANALLAIGAVPSMTTSPGEIAAFAGNADALVHIGAALRATGLRDVRLTRVSNRAAATANRARP